MLRRIAVLVAALVLLAACGDGGAAVGEVDDPIDLSAQGPRSDSGRVTIPGFEEVAVEVTSEAGDVLEWCLLLAAAAEQYRQGLMNVVDLGQYAGMLFDFADGERSGGFWMRDTPMPLSLAYLDAEGATVSTADMEPCLDQGSDCPTYRPEDAYADAVEVPQGELDDLGLDGPGARLRTTGPCSPP